MISRALARTMPSVGMVWLGARNRWRSAGERGGTARGRVRSTAQSRVRTRLTRVRVGVECGGNSAATKERDSGRVKVCQRPSGVWTEFERVCWKGVGWSRGRGSQRRVEPADGVRATWVVRVKVRHGSGAALQARLGPKTEVAPATVAALCRNCLRFMRFSKAL